MPHLKTKTMPPVVTNAGIVRKSEASASDYISRLRRMTQTALGPFFIVDAGRTARDATLEDEIRDALHLLYERWQAGSDGGLSYVRDDALRAMENARFQKGKAFAKAGLPHLYPPSQDMERVLRQESRAAVSSLKTIPDRLMRRLEERLAQTLRGGGDVAQLGRVVADEFNKGERHAAAIARRLVHNVTCRTDDVMSIAAGMPYAMWCHINPALQDQPRPDHLAAGREKRVYDRRQGCPISGEYIQPGEKHNCMCYSRTILKWDM